ncbi:MAG: histidine phosphatase family protein [Pseudomonadota bacterium]
MVTWWWVRHGPTRRTDLNGWTDVPADLGDADAVSRLAAFLPGDAAVVSSDLVRASATADAICGSRPRLPHQSGLREIHFGAWEARTFVDVEADNPKLFREYLESPGDIAPPGGESWNTLAARVHATVDALTSEAGHIIAVAHFGPILTQLQRAQGRTAREVLATPIRHLSVTRIEIDGEWRVQEVDHIP